MWLDPVDLGHCGDHGDPVNESGTDEAEEVVRNESDLGDHENVEGGDSYPRTCCGEMEHDDVCSRGGDDPLHDYSHHCYDGRDETCRHDRDEKSRDGPSDRSVDFSEECVWMCGSKVTLTTNGNGWRANGLSVRKTPLHL